MLSQYDEFSVGAAPGRRLATWYTVGMKLPKWRQIVPSWTNALLAVLAAVLLILAYPNFEIWPLAWIAFLPLLWAITREQDSSFRGFTLGWIFGVIFFFGSCWWLTFAPVTYAGFPPLLAYFLLFCVTVVAGIFPGAFGAVLAFLHRRFGHSAMFASPFIWIATEFARYWITGNNWNALAYSQAFSGYDSVLRLSSIGGVYLSGFAVLSVTTLLFVFVSMRDRPRAKYVSGLAALVIVTAAWLAGSSDKPEPRFDPDSDKVIAVQPNVPMSGLTPEKWRVLRDRHVELAEQALAKIPAGSSQPVTVIFPESPMNFMYDEDAEFREFIRAFAEKNNVRVLFNSAEPDPGSRKYFNSAVLVDETGVEIAQYDKIYLMPFGESVPAPLRSIVPALVGSFSFGSEYDLLPLGTSKAGVMICFESHFPDLSREYVRRGADVIIEMTNDGYLGPTPVLRQHLANAVFRAVETDRPVLRVTNVGITAYISERGDVIEATGGYTEDTRIWNAQTADAHQTVYVKYGDWFAWLCSIVTVILLAIGVRKKRKF